MERIQMIAYAGGISFFSTMLATLFLLVRQKPFSLRIQDAIMGLCAGAMLGAAIFSLLEPSYFDWLKMLGNESSSRIGALCAVFCFTMLGAIVLELLHSRLAHSHMTEHHGPSKVSDSAHQAVKAIPDEKSRAHLQAKLLAVAMGLHNLPEGASLGVGFATGQQEISGPLALSIALQNIPEGYLVAMTMMAGGASLRSALSLTALTALFEVMGVAFGVVAFSLSQAMQPAMLSLCAGAMIYVVSHEMIPDSHSRGHERWATFALLIGFLLVFAVSKVNFAP